MARKVFYSFHYVPDNWRAAQVRNMGVIEGEAPVSDNDWETVWRGGDKAIEKWIAAQLYGKSCTVVLVGTNTAGRKWITYELDESWKAGKGVVGVRIHNLKDLATNQSSWGDNPLNHVWLSDKAKLLSSIAKVYDPPYSDSKAVYAYIKDNLATWVDEAIQIRNAN